jgi:hypothetical protein
MLHVAAAGEQVIRGNLMCGARRGQVIFARWALVEQMAEVVCKSTFFCEDDLRPLGF